MTRIKPNIECGNQLEERAAGKQILFIEILREISPEAAAQSIKNTRRVIWALEVAKPGNFQDTEKSKYTL